MFCRFHFSRRFKWLLLAALIAALSLETYRFFHPPLPKWLQPPPGSSVLVSRRFLAFPIIHGPRYYFRIHSPLSARQTAQYFIAKGEDIRQYIPSAPTPNGIDYFSNYNLKTAPDKIALSIYFKPNEMYDESWDGEIATTFLVWPEERGSTIEFASIGGF
ncbi:MAG TPA: hypothetical protein VGB45_03765 [Abditibacterium sp.]|jgi:hypothetical protein